MLVILTPSKTMDFVTEAPDFVTATPLVFRERSDKLRAQLSQLSVAELERTMRVSPAIAASVQSMYGVAVAATKPALWAYSGDVYRGVQAQTLTVDDARFAQRHLLIPSALYGLVRPFDAVAPYRLEMSTKLAVGDAANLYDYWGDALARYAASYRQDDLLVLASKEYARAVLRHILPDINVVTPIFLDTKPDGSTAQVPIYSKMMRGVMARWVIDMRVQRASDINQFTAHDYHFDAARSTPTEPVFVRAVMQPLVFA